MFIKENGKFCFCWKCVSVALLLISMTVLFAMLFFKGGQIKANAESLLLPKYTSTEVRDMLLNLYIDGKLSAKNTELIVTQSSNQKKFKIMNDFTNLGTEIKLVPERYGEFEFPSVASWKFIFDTNDDLSEVLYYFQNNESFVISVKPYLSSIEVSLIVADKYMYRDIVVPMSIRNFIKMPFKNFITETSQLLYWDWIFSDNDYQEINNRSINLVNYLERKSIRYSVEREDNLFNEHIAFSDLEKKQLLLGRRKEETEYAKFMVDLIMSYIGTNPAAEDAFVPYTADNDLISSASEQYIPTYINNIKTFLDFYPDFYTSLDEIISPFYDNSLNELDSLQSNLYFMTVKYPGIWYIVPIKRLQTIEEQDYESTIGIEILIPYFSGDGNFHIYNGNLLTQYLEEAKNDKDVEYSYGDIILLRVPNEYKNSWTNNSKNNR